MKAYLAILLPMLFVSTITQASAPISAKTTDWSSYLQAIKANCDTSALDTPIPNSLKPSIVKLDNHRKRDDNIYIGKKVITLKNARFLGQPLTKILVDSNGYTGETVLYFANTGFMQLRPQFYMETDTANGKIRLYASDKKVIKDPDSFAGEYVADGNGYDDGLKGVTFDAKAKTISCGWAAA